MCLTISLCQLLSGGCEKTKDKEIKTKSSTSEEKIAPNNPSKKKQLKKGLYRYNTILALFKLIFLHNNY